MHARYDQYYIENLSALREWSSGEETIYTRKLLIVDEAPNLMKVSKLSTSVIAACEGMISTYKPSYELGWDKPKTDAAEHAELFAPYSVSKTASAV